MYVLACIAPQRAPNMGKRVDEASLLRSFAAPRRGSDALFEGVVGLMPGTWWRISATGIVRHSYFDVETAIDVERLDGVLDAAEDQVVDQVAGQPVGEQVTQALVEDDLRGHPGVGAAEHHGVRPLAGGEPPYLRRALPGVAGPAADEPPDRAVAGRSATSTVKCAIRLTTR